VKSTGLRGFAEGGDALRAPHAISGKLEDTIVDFYEPSIGSAFTRYFSTVLCICVCMMYAIGCVYEPGEPQDYPSLNVRR